MNTRKNKAVFSLWWNDVQDFDRKFPDPPKKVERKDKLANKVKSILGDPKWFHYSAKSKEELDWELGYGINKDLIGISMTELSAAPKKRKASEREDSQTLDVTAGPSGSSRPGNETQAKKLIKTSDQHMREGKRLKHQGDACKDPRTGCTRSGESLNRALSYFEAALCFIMNGCTLEDENVNGHQETSSFCPIIYVETIPILEHIRKMKPHCRQEEIAFARLRIACLRSETLLHKRVHDLKKDVAMKCPDEIKKYAKAYQMASPTQQKNFLLSPKGMNLMCAHEKWNKQMAKLSDHKDFFRIADVLSGDVLNMSSSLRHLATYNKIILQELRVTWRNVQKQKR